MWSTSDPNDDLEVPLGNRSGDSAGGVDEKVAPRVSLLAKPNAETSKEGIEEADIPYDC